MPIEQLALGLERIVSLDQKIEILATGLGGEASANGPLWWPASQKEGGYLLFSDTERSQRLKWTSGQGVTVVQEDKNRASGLSRDPQGRLIAAEVGARRVTRQEADGSITVVADKL